MALQDWSPEQIEILRKQGIDPNYATPAPSAPISKGTTIADTLKAHAGGLIGGSAAIPGMIAGGEIGALGGPAAPVTVPLGAIIGGAITGLGGSLIGQKTQGAILGDEKQQALEQAAALSAEANPYTALATDIGVGALASGGVPSPTTAVKGTVGIGRALLGKGLSQEAANVAAQAAINPAIATGISLAQGQGIPSGTDILAQAAGGALFSKSWLPNGRFNTLSEPKPEVNNTTTGDKTTFQAPSREEQTTPFTARTEKGDYALGNNSVKNIFLKQFSEVLPKDADDITKGYIRTRNEKLRTMPIDQMRVALHNRELEKTVQPESQNDPDYQGGEMPEVNNSWEAVPTKTIPTPSVADAPSTPLPTVERPTEVVPAQAEVQPVASGEAIDASRPSVAPVADSESKVTPVVNSPLSDYNRYNEVQRQMKEMGMDKMGSPEFQKLWKENEEIKNRYDGKVPPQFPENHVLTPVALQSHILNNKATTGSILHSLANTPDHPFQELSKHLLDISDTKSLNVRWNHDKTLDQSNDWRSHYDPDSDVVNIGTGSAGDSRVVIEEAIHSMTSKKIPVFLGEGAEHYNRLNTYLQKKGGNEAVKDLIRSYFETAKSLGIHDSLFKDIGLEGEIKGMAGNPDSAFKYLEGVGHGTRYAMGNLDEFIAQAIKDPSFQRVLENIKTTDGRNIWQKFVEAIKKILGLDAKTGSMLERVLRSSGELINQSRPDNISTGNKVVQSPPKDFKPLPKEEAIKLKEKSSFLPFLASRIDKIQDTLQTPVAKYVTDKLHKFMGEMSYQEGQIGNKLISQVRGATPEQTTKIYKYLHDMDADGKSDITLNEKEKSIASSITKVIREPRQMQINMGLKVRSGDGFRTAGVKENGYMFNMLDPKIAYEWTQNSESPTAKAYDKAYLDHQMKHGATPDEAQENLQEYKMALGNQGSPNVEFGAIRKAEGKGLPWELSDKNFASAARRYGTRAARDLAFFKHIESDPKMQAALGIKDQYGNIKRDESYIGGNEVVQKAMRSVYGVDMPRNPVLMTAARAVSNTVMGVGTAARNILNMPSFMANYVQIKQLPLVAKAIADYNSTSARAFESNAVRSTFKDLDAAGEFEGSPNRVVRLMDKYSAFMRKYNGRDFSDHFEGQLYYTLGEKLAIDNLARAKTGDKEALRFLERFGDLVEGGGKSLLGKQPTEDEISRIAKRFVDGARGTYTAEGLPSWAIEGELAPFTALSRFSIEKANTIWKDVIQPAKQGMYGPLLRYTFASLGVGLGIEQLNELLSGKRGPDAKVSEVLADGKPEDLIAKAVGLLQMASFAGIVGDSAKAAMSAWQNKGMKYNSPLSFPLYSLVTDTLAGNTADAVEAIKQGDDPFEVLGHLATDIATQSIQTMRYIDSNFVHKDETKRKELFRDYRVFNQLEGNPTPGAGTSNPYLDIDAKNYRKTPDIQEAMAMLPDLLKKAISDANGDPYKLKRNLQALKNNSYQTMPSMETAPLSFVRYINYLKQTQGEQAATDRLNDFVTQGMVNKVKSAVVP